MSFGKILYSIILYPLIQLIEISYTLFDKLFGNTGLSIIGVSFTVTMLCLPLYIVAEHWQQVERDTQTKLKPGIDRIKQTFKGDEQYMILSTFYKQNHYHPMMALRSSFGLLIQIPFFMAAYSCLSKMPALQGQSFLFIRDLGKQDAIFYIGSLPVNILPIAMTIINIIAGAIYTKGFAIKEKLQIYGMALLFLVILYTSPSGLVLYWTMNNVFSLIKNIFYKMKHPVKVLYIIMSTLCVCCAVYILFIYDGGASPKKRIAASLPMLFVIAIPLFLKVINWLLLNPLQELVENKKLRTTLFLLSAISLTILYGLIIPSSIISSSSLEFSNIGKFTCPNGLLHSPFWQSFGIFIFWSCCIYFLFGKNIQTIFSVIFGAGLLCSIINTYIFAGDYGSMDITLKFIDGINNPSFKYQLLNFFVDIVIWILLFILIKFKKCKIYNSIVFISIVAFIPLVIMNTSKTKKEYKEYENSLNSITETDIPTKFSLSKDNKNVIILMLDRSESSYVDSIFSEFPELNSSFDGFTYYKNTVSFNGHTLIATPPLYGGYEYTPDKINSRENETLKNKHNEALLVLPRIFTEQVDYNATVSDLSWANYSYYADVSFINNNYPKINAHKLIGRYTGDFKKDNPQFFETTITLSDSLERNLLFVSFFRSLPAIIRPAIYYDGSWWATESANDLDTFIDSYSALCYLKDITSYNSDKGNLIVITNEATHSNEDISKLHFLGDKTVSTSAGYENNVVCLKAIATWLDKMKEENVYDNTKIIIIADHGIGYGDYYAEGFNQSKIGGYEKDHLHPLFFVKDFNSHGNLKTDLSFMTTADVPTIACENIIENPINPFSNKSLSNKDKEDGVYITIDNLFMPYHSQSENIFTVPDSSWYKVSQNIFEDSNWIQEVPND